MKSVYDSIPSEKDACGTGFIARKDGIASHQVIADGLEVLHCNNHRGASIDGETGDGAGVTIQIPFKLINKELKAPVPEADMGLGMFFLPKATGQRDRAKKDIEKRIAEAGLEFVAWRNVPVNHDAIGRKARESEPDIEQAVFRRTAGMSDGEFEKRVYEARRAIESGVEDPKQVSVSSMNNRVVVYKGLMMADQLEPYYGDLRNPDCESNHILYHVRFSTNTTSAWYNTQPFQSLGHNGEINTIGGNQIEWMSRMREDGGVGAKNFAFVKGLSDSGRLDMAVQNLLHNGYGLDEALIALVPPAWQNDASLGDKEKGLLRYYSRLQSPFDGPAALIATDGKKVAVHLDSKGLRPLRYSETDKYVMAGSEEGLLPVTPANVQTRGSLRAGDIVSMDLATGKVSTTHEILKALAEKNQSKIAALSDLNYTPAREREEIKGALPPESNLSWVVTRSKPLAYATHYDSALTRAHRQKQYGWYTEVSGNFIKPMVEGSKEPVIAMGNDRALPMLSKVQWPLFEYFKQRFAQVTNPPIDSIREHSDMSLQVLIGGRPGAVGETGQHWLDSPILRPGQLEALRKEKTLASAELHAAYAPGQLSGEAALEEAVRRLCKDAEKAVKGGASVLVLSDRALKDDEIVIPAPLAVAAVNQHLIDRGMRRRASIIAETGQLNNPHDASVLLGFGASAVNSFMMYEDVAMHYPESAKLSGREIKQGKKPVPSQSDALENLCKAMDTSVLKIMSKMGIRDVQSYIGAKQFEAIGLDNQEPLRPGEKGWGAQKDKSLLQWAFSDIYSPVRGHQLVDIVANYQAFRDYSQATAGNEALPHIGKFLSLGKKPDTAEHGYSREVVKLFADMVKQQESQLFKIKRNVGKGASTMLEGHQYTKEEMDRFTRDAHYKEIASKIQAITASEPLTLLDLLELKPNGNAHVTKNEVQSVSDIVKTFSTGGMSLGALTAQAHEACSRAMNGIGARSNSGEGGADPKTYDDPHVNNAIKQAASARFGLTAAYLASLPENGEVEIKIAQGAKPGEGGQLPAQKVTVEIARRRGSLPGVELISPPPHHDIYSIEDLKQFIHDLKGAGRDVGVKLVASEGIGTIAVGVAKAGADVISIASGSGGTGAASITSVHHAGMPSEVGLSDVDRALRQNGIRDMVKLRTSGGFKTGKDIVKMAMLGADQFEFGTTALVLLDCVIARKCFDKCPVGLTTDGEKFNGDPKNLQRYMLSVADEVRDVLASVGAKSLREVRGRTDLLQRIEGQDVCKTIDMSPLLDRSKEQTLETKRPSDRRLDDNWLEKAKPVFEGRKNSVTIEQKLSNCDLSVGSRFAVEWVRRLKQAHSWPPGNSEANFEFTGVAGQSFGAFTAPGMHLRLTAGNDNGIAVTSQDGVAKGMSGGSVALVAPKLEGYQPEKMQIAGNACLYGATGGEAFFNGKVGDRFAVRNSGASVVVEGVGDKACEYMTSGAVLNLGEAGKDFGVGMAGGIAVQYDPKNSFSIRDKSESDKWVKLVKPENQEPYQNVIQTMLMAHVKQTHSALAQDILSHWDQNKRHFKIIVPRTLDKVITREQMDNVKLAYEGRNITPLEGTWMRYAALRGPERDTGFYAAGV